MPDLVPRQVVVATPEQLWIAVITHISIIMSFVSLSVALNIFNRRIVARAIVMLMRLGCG